MSIAQDIRREALFPSFTAEKTIGSEICHLFADPLYVPWDDCPSIQWPTFLLFVAEALDGGAVEACAQIAESYGGRARWGSENSSLYHAQDAWKHAIAGAIRRSAAIHEMEGGKV